MEVAEVLHIVVVVFVEGIPQVKIHQPIGFDAADPGVTDLSLPGQRIPRVFNPAHNLPLVVAEVGVDVHLVAVAILEHEVMLPLVIARHMPITQAAEDAQETRQVLLVDGDIQVGMGTGLPAQVRIHRPTTVDHNRDSGNFCQVDDTQRFILVHLGSLV